MKLHGRRQNNRSAELMHVAEKYCSKPKKKEIGPEPLLKRESEPNGRKYKDLNGALNSARRRWTNGPALWMNRIQAWKDSRNNLRLNVRTLKAPEAKNWQD